MGNKLRNVDDYYLGLDIGTESVGWAVTDKDYVIPKFKGNAMWGVHLFDEGETSVKRRGFRSARRRTQRKRERLALLEALFDEEISKKDCTFFRRLHESDLWPEDKSGDDKYAVFADENYTDKDFHKECPTIYHLRYELIKNKEPHDVRLVFLALHHIIKNRGHFLFDSLSSAEDFNSAYETMCSYLSDNEIQLNCSDIEQFKAILKDRRQGKIEKTKNLASLFGITKKSDPVSYAVMAVLSGSTVKMCDLFGDDELKTVEKNNISFASGYEENEEIYASVLGDRFELVNILKAVYDWAVLADILDGKKYISEAKVAVYEKHKNDLKTLKKYVKTYLPEKYNEIFKISDGKKDNYVAYSGHIKESGKTGELKKTCDSENFCAYLKKTLGKNADLSYKEMFDEIENKTFMPKQVTKSNGVVPMQVNEEELKAILDNAKDYLPFLNSCDENGVSVYDKIIKIFEYRIPYYVGPLNTHTEKSWLKRKDGVKIYPWNFDDVVDIDSSAEKFINNLTSKCTYLPECDVIPKCSLLYSKFTVLNEINNLKLNGEDIPVELKQGIYNDLFMTRRKVTVKQIKDYLKARGCYDNNDVLSGIDTTVKSSLKSYFDFKDFESLTFDDKESIIASSVIFGDDKKLLKKRLKKLFPEKLTDEDIKKICKLKYTGWSRLSKEFLCDVEFTYKKTGEVMNVITALWETNYNLMQILYSEDFCCDGDEKKNLNDKLDELSYTGDQHSLRKAVDALYVSPKVKRPILRALLIAKEIEKIQERPPKKIFVEVARGIDNREERHRDSRKSRLMELYKNCKKEAEKFCPYFDALSKKLSDEDESKLRSDKLYFYYIQLGHCMYTGEEISLGELMNGNGRFDIDHIYPQSKIKDDSLTNRVLVNRTVNADKTNVYPIDSAVQAKMSPYWQMLRSSGLISEETYKRLTRKTPLTDDELSAFVSRQLTETQQSTKAVAHILEQLYPKPKTEIVYVKAALAHAFRQSNDMLKCREVNDLHHAKDAYLNIVVGNAYNVKVTHNKVNFIKGLQNNDKGYTVNPEKFFSHDIPGAWSVKDSMNTVRRFMNKNNIRYTRFPRKKQGGLFKINPLKKGNGQVPLKASGARSCIKKYGGYDKATSAYFSYVEYTDKKGKAVRQMFPVNLYEVKEYEADMQGFVTSRIDGASNVKILIPCVKYDACISFDGCRMFMSNKTGNRIGYKPGIQLVLGYKYEKYIRNITNYLTKHKDREIIPRDNISAEENTELYDVLTGKMLNTVLSVKFSGIGKKLEKHREEFVLCSPEEQCYVLNEILKILHANVLLGDLRLIGESPNAGVMLTNAKFSEIKDVHSIKLINQSVTGLFEQEIDLLK